MACQRLRLSGWTQWGKGRARPRTHPGQTPQKVPVSKSPDSVREISPALRQRLPKFPLTGEGKIRSLQSLRYGPRLFDERFPEQNGMTSPQPHQGATEFPPDPFIEEVHDLRGAASERFGHDLHRIAEHLRQVERANPLPAVQPPKFEHPGRAA